MLKSAQLAFIFVAFASMLPSLSDAGTRPDRFYDLHYRAEFKPQTGVVHVELRLSGERLPSQITFTVDPQRHRSFTSTHRVAVSGSAVSWRPQGKAARLEYDFVVNHERSSRSGAGNRFDSYMTKDWALFRADRLVPRAKVTAPPSLKSRATLEFVLPRDWSAITPYERTAGEPRVIDDATRRFDRPEGWMIAGKLGTRSEMIGSTRTIIASPTGDSARRQDMLAFLNYNLPQLAGIFRSLPPRLLIVSAGEPMWRGGLSAPGSLFVHAQLPLISENRTSTLLHELSHVAMGIHGDDESDWIVEGFAEYYSIEALRRSGGISQARHDDAMRHLQTWARRAPTLFVKASAGATTARAVLTLRDVDQEIRKTSGGKSSLDDVARELARSKGEVSLVMLQSIAEKVAGRRVQSLERAKLSGPFAG